jgi:GntP family gluconate:H+ symporter
MYGMPLSQALVFTVAAFIIIVATQWRHFHPFLVLVVVATAFGYVAGYPTSQLGSLFGGGFGEKIYSPGLVIVAASLIAGLSEATAASDRLMAQIDRWRWLAASPAAAFALITPLLRPIGGGKPQGRQSATIALALAISAAHGLLVLSPVPIAAVAILGARWDRVALFGLPLAIFVVGCGAVFAVWSSTVDAAPAPAEPAPGREKQSGGSAIVLLSAAAIPLLLLMVQSLGDIPSEPLGGGQARELVIGIGRPLILFLAGVGIMLFGNLRHGLKLLADPDWTGRLLGSVSSILLIVGAAGSLQSLCQQTGMAEMVGEHLLGSHGVNALGVLAPFLITAGMKTLQGSSLVAAITSAGMVQPILLPLGLADANGTALAALAVGAGAMTVCHVNDDYFWLVANKAGLSPLRAIATVSVGTLLQGVIAATALVILAALISHA